ncbi:MAG: threonine-phosphate decarboxylase [Halanaeroarchaeum sp.]
MDPDSVDTVDRVPHGGVDDDRLDFSANVNPETPPGVESVYRDALPPSRRYPPEPPEAFRRAAADYVDVDPETVVPTPGGLAAIRLALATHLDPDDRVLVPAPGFGEYAREVRLQGATPVRVPADEVLAGEPTAYDVAVVCNPNNPTGTVYDRERLVGFVREARRAGTPVLIDEAFLGFTDRETVAGTPGAIVARSLTKLFGLPGLRAGFAVARDESLSRLEAARRPWNLGAPALAVGAHVVGQTAFVRETRERVATERERMRETLAERFRVSPSAAPFLLLEVVDEPVAAVIDRADDAGIAIRDARSFVGLDAHVRVAVRLPAENRRLEAVLLDD